MNQLTARLAHRLREIAGEEAEKAGEAEEGAGSPGYVMRRLMAVLRQWMRKLIGVFRPRFHIRDAHLRYENFGDEAEVPCALGLVLGSLAVEHPPDREEAASAAAAQPNAPDVETLHIDLQQLGVYCHTMAMGATSVIGAGPTSAAANAPSAAAGASSISADVHTVRAMRRLLREVLIDVEADAELGDAPSPFPAHQWLLRPIYGRGRAHVNLGIFLGAPSRFEWPQLAVVELTLSALSLSISEAQASALLCTLSAVMMWPARSLYTRLKSAEETLEEKRRVGPVPHTLELEPGPVVEAPASSLAGRSTHRPCACVGAGEPRGVCKDATPRGHPHRAAASDARAPHHGAPGARQPPAVREAALQGSGAADHLAARSQLDGSSL